MATPLDSKIFDHYEDARKRISGARYIYERNWFRNVLYLIGIQWIKYSPGSRRWMQKEIKPWVPKPVTNKFATHAVSMQQTLTQRAPSILCSPGSKAPADKAAADQANRFLPSILKEAGWDEARRQVVPWMCLTGNAFLHVYYDNNPKWGMTEVEGQKMPKGKLRFETFSPFEIYIDPELRCMAECEDLIVRRRYPVETVKRRWGVAVDPIGPGADSGTGLTMLKQIAYASGTGEGMLSSGSEYSNSAIIDQYWKRPCDDFPKGCVAVFANGNLLNGDSLADGLPYLDRNEDPIWPWHQFVFDRVPGRIYGRTPLDDVAPKQEQRNKLESLIQLIVSRSASPGWLIPKGSGIGIIGGEPGFQMEYNPLSIGPGGAIKPERIPGDGIQTSLIAWLEKIDKDMEELAGTFEVLKGQAPPGVTAGTALRLLLERAVTRFTPVLQGFEDECANAVKSALTIFQQLGVDSRTAIAQGEGNTWEITEFSNADIEGNVDVIVESGSAMPQSTVGFEALVQDLVTTGFIDPKNAETRYKVIERFGITDVLGSEDANVKQAERENYRFVAEKRDPVVNPALDNHPIHIQVHSQWALTSEFEEADPVVQMKWMQHISEHKMLLAQSMAPPPVMPGQQSGVGPGMSPTSGMAKAGGPAEPNPVEGSPAEPSGNEEPPFPGVM